MSSVLRLLDSTVGQKVIAAATGIGLIAFVISHLLGNLQMFLGQDAINGYAVMLKDLGALLWVARFGLLLLVSLHIAITVRLAWRSRAARNGRYANPTRQTSTVSSRYMIVSGSIILAFVVFHLLHFTFGWVQPDLHRLTDAEGRHDVYSMVAQGFHNWAVAGFYILAMLFLCSHLTHAFFSPWQSLGVNLGGKDSTVKRLARYAAVITVLGFISIPVAALLGWFE
jgi:succinate dehydrogenase / fumarate reductase cytochrome b subunit